MNQRSEEKRNENNITDSPASERTDKKSTLKAKIHLFDKRIYNLRAHAHHFHALHSPTHVTVENADITRRSSAMKKQFMQSSIFEQPMMPGFSAKTETISNCMSALLEDTYFTYPQLLFAESEREKKERQKMKELADRLEAQISSVKAKATEVQKLQKLAADLKGMYEKLASPFIVSTLSGMINHTVLGKGETVWASTTNLREDKLIVINPNTSPVEVSVAARPPQPVTCMAAAGKYIWVGTMGPDLYLYTANAPEIQPRTLCGHSVGPVTGLIATTGPLEHSLEHRQPTESKAPKVPGHLSAALKSGVVLSTSSDCTIIVWDISTQRIIQTSKEIKSVVLGLCTETAGSVWLSTTNGVYQLDTLDDCKTAEIATVGSISKEVSECGEEEERENLLRLLENIENITCLVSASGEVWGCNGNAIVCFDTSTKRVSAVLDHPLVTSMIAIGKNIYSFSCDGVMKWDVKEHQVLSVLTDEPCFVGVQAFRKDQAYVWAGCASGGVFEYPTHYTKHHFELTQLASPAYCNICHKSLWCGERECYQCTHCRSFNVHRECFCNTLSTFVCNGSEKLAANKQLQRQTTQLLLNFTKKSSMTSQVKATPESIAKSIFSVRSKINPAEVGDWLGSKGNEEVVRHWAGLLNLGDLDFEMALRRFISSFMLPGEGQKIDRLMVGFAEQYTGLSREVYEPPLFASKDACYVLSYSYIMLNTALHNPDSPINMTVEQWINSNQGFNEDGDKKGDFDRDFLCHLYYQLAETPLELFTVAETPIMQGYLKYEGKPVFCKLQDKSFTISKKASQTPMWKLSVDDLSVLEQLNADAIMVLDAKSGRRFLLEARIRFTLGTWMHAFGIAGATALI